MSYTLNALTEADYANGIPEKWIPLLRYDSYTKSVTQKFEGAEGSMSAIIKQIDVSKGNADTFHFQTLANLYGKGRSQNAQLKGFEEKATLGQFDLTVAQTRHAVSYKSTLKILSLYKPGEWARPQLAKWHATRMDNDCFKQYVTTDVQKVIYAGDAASEDTLIRKNGTISSISVDALEKANASLEAMGADPIEVVRKNGQVFPIYGCFVSPLDKWNLKRDPKFAKANELANLRGEDNPIFTGAFGMIGSMLVYVVPTLRGWGNPIRPEAKVYGAHNASASTLVVGSDQTGIIDYTEFFPSSGTLSVRNSLGAIEYMTYDSKTTYSFNITARGATYGDKTSTASSYTGGATDEEYVTLGHLQSNIICFGAQSMMRGEAQTMTEIEQKEDYGQEVGIGISFIAGHKAVKTSAGNNKGYLIMKAASYPYDAVA